MLLLDKMPGLVIHSIFLAFHGEASEGFCLLVCLFCLFVSFSQLTDVNVEVSKLLPKQEQAKLHVNRRVKVIL